MVDLDPSFVERVKPGDIIVAGRNFGCGSSREHAPVAIKAAGVTVIAPSFSRIFYRNSINMGLLILECAEAAEGIEDGDEVEVDFSSGMIHTSLRMRHIRLKPLNYPEKYSEQWFDRLYYK